MCGIAGIWRRDGAPVGSDEIATMLDRLSHRGPDGTGMWSAGPVALGHTRLKILDTSDRAAQPMLTPDKKGVLTYNGEVYNYVDLRRRLEAEGERFVSTGDTEVVLRALHVWGPEKAIPEFNGMFALAYLDQRDGALWLARDRTGIKPMVFAEIDGDLIFGSEPKALLADPRLSVEPDMRALTMFLMGQPLGPRFTGFTGIRVLPPGTWWKVTTDTRPTTYFDVVEAVDPVRAARPADPPEALTVAFRDSFAASVDLHLASDVPVAAMCSGGVDSSLVTAFALKRKRNLTAYVADMPFERGEGDQAERAARHLGVPITRVKVDREVWLRLWPESIWYLDAPGHLPSTPAKLAVSRQCRADDIGVLLTGEGSDELFGGYDRYERTHRIALAGQRALDAASTESARRRVQARLRMNPFSVARGSATVDGRARHLAAGDADIELMQARLMDRLHTITPRADRALVAHCIWDIHESLPRLLLDHDRLGMAASIETRVPFIENGLIDFAFHAPRVARLRDGKSKWVVKAVAEEHLPADIVHAPKKGFPAPLEFCADTEAFFVEGTLPDLMEWSRATTLGIAEIARTSHLLRYHLVSLEIWLRLYFHGADPDALGENLVRMTR